MAWHDQPAALFQTLVLRMSGTGYFHVKKKDISLQDKKKRLLSLVN
jgi:hypothetical protein